METVPELLKRRLEFALLPNTVSPGPVDLIKSPSLLKMPSKNGWSQAASQRAPARLLMTQLTANNRPSDHFNEPKLSNAYGIPLSVEPLMVMVAVLSATSARGLPKEPADQLKAPRSCQ